MVHSCVSVPIYIRLLLKDVVYALHGMGYNTGVDLNSLAETGDWISKQLGRPNSSRVGQAIQAKVQREREARIPHAKL